MSHTSLASLASEEAARNRARLLEVFGSSKSCAVGAFCLEDLSLLAELQAETLYLLVANNNHSAKSKINASPDARGSLIAGPRMRDSVASEHAMVRAFPDHHAKYWLKELADDEKPSGALFSGDLTSSCLCSGAKCGNSHEYYLELNDRESVELRSFVRWLMVSRPAVDVLPGRDLELKGGLAKLPSFKCLLVTVPSKTIQKAVLSLIDSASLSIDVTSWAIAQDNEVFKSLLAACGKKHVTVLSHDEPSNFLALRELQAAGASVKLCPKMHAKLWVADREGDARAIVTSANMMTDGMDVGIEVGLSLLPGDSRIADISSFISKRFEISKPLSDDSQPKAKKMTGDFASIEKVIKLSPKLKLF